MSGFMISIVGVICLGILLEIVMPEGKTAKYVRGAFSLLVIFVLISPLPTLLKKDLKVELDNFYEVDEAYISQSYDNFRETVERQINEKFAEGGIAARAEVELFEGSSELKAVRIYAAKELIEQAARYLADKTHIDEEKIICVAV